MGTISLDKAARLYWLGRYTERVFTTIKIFLKCYDEMIDGDKMAYVEFCKRLCIPNIYNSKKEFKENYIFDEENPDSIYSNFLRALDNAMMLRKELSSQSLAYIEMAINKLVECKYSESLLMDLQSVIDYLFAFWASVDDYLLSEAARNILKTGRYLERLDLYIRFSYNYSSISKEYCKLKNRIGKSKLKINTEYLDKLDEKISKESYSEENLRDAINYVENLIVWG